MALNILEFEKPVLELEKKIEEMRKMSDHGKKDRGDAEDVRSA